MKVQPSTLGWVVVTGALSVALVFSHWPRPEPGKKVPEKVQRSADSLELTRPELEHRQDSVLAVAKLEEGRAARAERLAKAARDSSEGFRKRADTLGAQARLWADSTFLWRLAYEARTDEAEQLRTSLDSTSSALGEEKSAKAHVDGLLSEAVARQHTSETVVIPGLERAIAKLEHPCRIVGRISCPSRRTAFVLGTVSAVAILSAAK